MRTKGFAMSNTQSLNEWIKMLPRFHDPMNDYYRGTLWLDTDTGTFGDSRTLVLIDTTEWTQDDCDTWECWTDSERNLYGFLVSEKYGPNYRTPPTPSEVKA